MRKSLYVSALLLAFTSIFSTTECQELTWQKIAPGIWKATVGEPEKLDLLTAAGSVPAISLPGEISDPGFPLNKERISAIINDNSIYISLHLDKKEQIYGFGLNFKTVQQRGRILQLHVDHYGGNDNGRTHAPVPFYVSDLGYGVFINSARYLTVYAGTTVNRDRMDQKDIKDRNTDRTWTSKPYSDAVDIRVPAKGCEIYIFAGPQPVDAVKRFNMFSGGGCLPPRWGLGFTQRVPTLFTSENVLEEVNSFAERGFPLDFVGLEPGWQSKSYPCTFEWDKSRFPDPASFIKTMKEKGIRINLWTNPYVSPESPVYKSLLPYSASHTVWGGIVPDYSLEKAAGIFTGQLNSSQIGIGVSGYKLDENDGYDSWLWPDVAIFPSGNSAEQMRQTYGLLLQRMTYETFRKNNTRTYGLTRASNGGGARFPYVIYNDYYSHQDFITALINSGFSGVLWTPEVRGSKTAEEWLRRFQTVVFSPMAMINAWADGTKPWSFPEVEKEVRYYALLRMQLLPYFYTEFAKYHFEGIPPFRGMALEKGFDAGSIEVLRNENLSENPYAEAVIREIRDQYMAGEYLLVAPLFAGQTSRKVVLPKGKWYDFYTGKYAGSGEIITVTPGIERIPVFVKDGGIIPMMPPLLHAPAAGSKIDIEVRYYGTSPGKYLLYDDDGETFAYEKGEFSWRRITVITGKNGKPSGSISAAEKGKPDNLGKITFRYMSFEE
ncbi:MAG: glycoside hydrolase family 31 protein [Bacteroidales bacterium]